jgi:hypothetical protein
VLNKSFAADEGVWSGKRSRVAVSGVNDNVGDNSWEEACIDLVNVISNMKALVERVLACATVPAFCRRPRLIGVLDKSIDKSVM